MKKMKLLIPVFVLMMGLFMVSCEDENQIINGDDSEMMSPSFKSGGVTDYLFDVITDIKTLVDEGVLNSGNGKALIKHLENAIRAIEREDQEAAGDQLVAFMEQLEEYVTDGKIDCETRDELAEVPNAINESFDWQCGDPILDIRDGNVYKTVGIGEQCWFAENLAYLPVEPGVSPSSGGSGTVPYYYVYGYHGNDVDAAKLTDNYNTYGVLYNWHAATVSCPDGWHLASDEEWQTMEIYLGMSETEANAYGWGRTSGDVGWKIKSSTGWCNNGNGDINSKFNALPGGARYKEGTFGYLPCGTLFWSSERSSIFAFHRALDCNNKAVYRSIWTKDQGFSVRCMKDS